MKKVSLIVALLIISLIMFSGCSGSGDAAGLVNGEKVPYWQYQSDIDMNLASYEAFYAAYGVTLTDDMKAQMMPQFEYDAWNSAIANEIIIQAAEDEGITVTEEETENYIEENVLSQFEDDAAFEDWLTQRNLTRDQMEELIRVSQYYNKLYDQLTADVSVSEEDARAKYEEDPTQWDEVQVSHILLMVSDEEETSADEEDTAEENADGSEASGDESDEAQTYNDEEALALAEELIGRLNEGEDFATLAQEYSDDSSASQGGLIDQYFTINDTSLVTEFVQGSFTLENIGDYTQTPVKTDYGYHIIKLDDARKGFDQLKDDIVSTMTSEQKDDVFGEYMTQRMDDAEIERTITFEYWTEGNDQIPLHRNFFQKIGDTVKGWFNGNQSDEGGTTDTDEGAETDDGSQTDSGTDDANAETTE